MTAAVLAIAMLPSLSGISTPSFPTLSAPTLHSPTNPAQIFDPLKETPAGKDLRMQWWREARFGMFIHWGLYSIPAGEWNGKNYPGAGEWLMNNAQIPVADYEPLQQQFNPVKFNAKEWVRIAKEAGMKYIVITSKHHDGFALWPSKFGTWNVGNSPFKRDPLKELADACREEGIKFCLYHSILDWHHPDFLPREGWDKRPTTGADFNRYLTVFRGQLDEIMQNYDPAVLWFDGEWKGWSHELGMQTYRDLRRKKPSLIINNRVDVGRAGMSGSTAEGHVGDFGTPEQEIPANGFAYDWESCMTMNGSWGYHKNDTNWKSARTLIENLVDCASKGGNYLLNVGPTDLGEIPTASIERLAEVGKWMKRNGESVYGTVAGPFKRPMPWGKVTRKGNTLFAVVFDEKADKIELPGLKSKVNTANYLRERALLITEATDRGLTVDLRRTGEPGEIRVVQVNLAEAPLVEDVPLGQDADGNVMLFSGDAKTTGNTRFEADKKCLGFWTDLASSATWEFAVKKGGSFKVEVEYACEEDSSGATIGLSIAGRALEFEAQGTGGWSSFKKVTLGPIEIDSDTKATAMVVAKSKPKYAAMNLRSVRLVKSP